MPPSLETLDAIQRRVLWLSTLIVHHANHVRPNPDGVKVGGHQASSASVVSILTALYFGFLRAGDRVSIKPHAAPAFHAVQYLLGRLPRSALTQLREKDGLQAYPSRTKDLDPVDFSTGSVGFGAVAPAFAALTNDYLRSRGRAQSRRFIALLGDAELDEGNVWEALLDESLSGLHNVLWVVDLNRQSLDRVIPGIRAARLRRLFTEVGWRVIDVKYGRKLQAVFKRPGGGALRQRIDDMSNEEYQALIRLPGPALREQLLNVDAALAGRLERALGKAADDELPGLLADLGGHDLAGLLAALADFEAEPARPTVIFAYTVKGWGLPFAGHPLNHSMLLNAEQMEALREALGVRAGAEWEAFAPGTPEAELCAAVAERLREPDTPAAPPAVELPAAVAGPFPEVTNTQDMFGRILTRLADHAPLREYIVTTSPDVSISTSLAGWINKTGVYAPQELVDYETETQRLMRWAQRPSGQHIELGISEMNLFSLLGMLGLSAELCGQVLVPIGTVYDPFICRGLDALIYSLYSGAKFIFAGTPSGTTLSREGGAHQSTITPSIGLELPRLNAYEPCYAQELEWIVLDAIGQCLDRAQGRSTYLRLTTRPVEQRPFKAALAREGEAALRAQVLAGGYRLLDWREAPDSAREALGTDPPRVLIAAAGAVLPEAVAAAEYLWEEGVGATVLNTTSPRRLYESWPGNGRATAPAALIRPDERGAPIVTVQDGASHSLAWLGGLYGAPVTALGVDDFGQSAARADLYHYFGLDAMSIAAAAFEAVDRSGGLA
jgi:pyruvate dehydrogenase E1 component